MGGLEGAVREGGERWRKEEEKEGRRRKEREGRRKKEEGEGRKKEEGGGRRKKEEEGGGEGRFKILATSKDCVAPMKQRSENLLVRVPCWNQHA